MLPLNMLLASSKLNSGGSCVLTCGRCNCHSMLPSSPHLFRERWWIWKWAEHSGGTAMTAQKPRCESIPRRDFCLNVRRYRYSLDLFSFLFSVFSFVSCCAIDHSMVWGSTSIISFCCFPISFNCIKIWPMRAVIYFFSLLPLTDKMCVLLLINSHSSFW